MLHITNGDHAAARLRDAGLTGDVLAWRDVLYEGPRRPAGWPDDAALAARASFLASGTGGALNAAHVLDELRGQYQKLAEAAPSPIVLWFDACLFDQSMLSHLLACLRQRDARQVELIEVDSYPGITPFHGLGQLTSSQLAGLYGRRLTVNPEQFVFASDVDRAFAEQDLDAFTRIAALAGAPLRLVPAAVARWLREQPDPVSGLGRLETLALAAIRQGVDTPAALFAAVSSADTPPQYWGDTTLWAKINGLAEHQPPLVAIDGPTARLPQWGDLDSLAPYRVRALDSPG